MRVYALLLGITLTAGYGYTADVAVSSLSAGRQALAATAAAAAPAAGHTWDNVPGAVWYGGVLDPVTVETDGRVSAKQRALSRRALRCPDAARSSFRTIT
jgi:hypothetical protein